MVTYFVFFACRKIKTASVNANTQIPLFPNISLLSPHISSHPSLYNCYYFM